MSHFVSWNNKRFELTIYPNIKVSPHAIERYRERILNEDVDKLYKGEFKSSVSDKEIVDRIRVNLWSLTVIELKKAVFSGKIWVIYTKTHAGLILKYYVKCVHPEQYNVVESVVNYCVDYIDETVKDGVEPYMVLPERIIASDNAISEYQMYVENVPSILAKSEIEHAVGRYKYIKVASQTRFKLSPRQNRVDVPLYEGTVYNSNRIPFYVFLKRNNPKPDEDVGIVVAIRVPLGKNELRDRLVKNGFNDEL